MLLMKIEAETGKILTVRARAIMRMMLFMMTVAIMLLMTIVPKRTIRRKQ